MVKKMILDEVVEVKLRDKRLIYDNEILENLVDY